MMKLRHAAALALTAIVGLTARNVRAQSPLATATPMATTVPGGAAAIREPTSMATRGVGSPGVISHPQPIEFNVGGEPVFPPTRECSALMIEALRRRAPVAIPPSDRPESDRQCEEEMKRALTLERTRPECTSGPCW